MRSTALTVAPLLVLLGACAGGVDDPAPVPGVGGPMPTGTDVPLQPGDPNAPPVDMPPGDTVVPPPEGCVGEQYIPPRRMSRIQLDQYVNIVRDLMRNPDAVPDSAAVDSRLRDFAPLPETGITTSELNQVSQIARFAAGTLTGDALTSRLACQPGAAEDDCVSAFLTSFATQAFARAPGAEEMAGLMGVYALGKETSMERGVQLAVQAVLQAPSTMLRVELGDPAAVVPGQPVALTPYEIARQLGTLLLDSLPDPELTAAAADGSLGTPEGIEAQVDRLLALPQVQDNLTRALVAAYGANRVFLAAKDPTLFPEFNGLATSMYEETRQFVSNIVTNPAATLDELLLSRTSYVDEKLADLYGIPYTGGPGGEFVQVELPAERAGVLTQASVLTTRARTDTTSVVSRGLYVRGELLCQPKISVPMGAILEQVEAQAESDMSELEKAAARAENPVCGGCHGQFDRFGLLLERFDAIGKYRTDDEGTPIDAGADLTGLAGFMGAVPDVVSFTQQVAQGDMFQSCVSENVLAYSLNEPRENATGTDCNIYAINQRLDTSGFTINQLVKAVTTSNAFRFRNVGE